MKGPTLRTLNRPPKYQAPPIGLVGGSSSNLPSNPTFTNVNISGDLTVVGDTSLGSLNAGTIFGASFSTLGRVADPGVVNADEVVANNVTAVGFYGNSIDVDIAGVVDLNLSGDIIQSSGANILKETNISLLTQTGVSTISQTGTGENVFKDSRIGNIIQTATHNIMQSGSGANVLRDTTIGVIEQLSPHNIIQYSSGATNNFRSSTITGTLTVSGALDSGVTTCSKLTADTTVEATTRLRIAGRNVFGFSTSTKVYTFTTGTAFSIGLDAAQGCKYLMVATVTFDDTSNNSVWRFLGSNRLYTSASAYTYEDHDVWSPSLKYTNDLFTISWTYVFTTGVTTYSSNCPLYLKPFITATPTTAKYGSLTVQLIYLDRA